MASPPLWTEPRIASAAAKDNFEGSLASQINACVSRRIIGIRLRTGYVRLVRRSIDLRCGGESFLDLLGLKDLPIFQGDHWRFDIADDVEFVGHESEDVVLLGLYGNDLNDRLSAFGHDHRFAGRLDVIHNFEALRFEGAGSHLLHGVFSVFMVILT